jgi:pyrroline-5-carboxylate reductase
LKIGFIGCGNMGGAIIKGIIAKKIATAKEIIVSDKGKSKEVIEGEFGVEVAENNREVAKKSDILFLAIKPQYYESVIGEIKEEVKENQIIISIAPGKTLQWLETIFAKPVKLIRVMPNTPALIGEGMLAVCPGNLVSSQETETILTILNGCGKTQLVEENLMDVVVSVSGSSPAYVFMLIEAMADAAVADGMPRAMAYEFAGQAVMGSAKLLLETGKHPGELKDMVCSPAGTTIEAVRVLEEKGFRSSIIEAMKTCTSKSRKI